MLRSEGEHLAGGHIYCIQRLESVLQLHAIGADVLHWRCAHRSGNQRHVFQTWVTLAQRPSHAVVPSLSSPSLDDPGFGGFLDQTKTLDLHLEHGGLDIARQHDVAAAAQHKKWSLAQRWIATRLQQIRHLANANQIQRTGCDTEGVPRL